MDSEHAMFLSASGTPRILPGSTITGDRNGDLFFVVPEGTFYGDPDIHVYASDHLSRLTQEGGVITEEIIRTAFAETEDGFLTVARGAFPTRNLIAAVGSCCLVGVIWNRTLYVANLGDSRAVLGYSDRSNRAVSEQLTIDHNPDDIVIQVGAGAWRINAIIQVSTAVGPRNRFLIFASDGLWECSMNPQRAIETVYNNHRLESSEDPRDFDWVPDWVPDFAEDFDPDNHVDNEDDGAEPDLDGEEIDYPDDPGDVEEGQEDASDDSSDDSSDKSDDDDSDSSDDDSDRDESEDKDAPARKRRRF